MLWVEPLKQKGFSRKKVPGVTTLQSNSSKPDSSLPQLVQQVLDQEKQYQSLQPGPQKQALTRKLFGLMSRVYIYLLTRGELDQARLWLEGMKATLEPPSAGPSSKSSPPVNKERPIPKNSARR
jgi:hypothetical protein